MRGKLGNAARFLIGSCLAFWLGSFSSAAHAAAPDLVVQGLVVNNASAACGAVVHEGDSVCVSFSSSQNAAFSVSVRKDDGPSTVVQQGSIMANSVHRTCVIAGPEDGIARTFQVSVNNSNGSDADTCSYFVGTPSSSSAPDVTILGLRVNGVTATCGATVMSGDLVCVRFRSDQDAFATVSVQKGGTTTLVARGAFSAGITYRACVAAGTPDDITRTIVVSVTNANGSDSESCSYKVAAVSPHPPSVTIGGLRIDGVAQPCGAAAQPGDQVCVRFLSDQSANAMVTVQKGTTTTIVARGSIGGGITYFTCVTAGAADDVTRTFGVKVSNANGSDSETCAYTVPR